MKNTTDSQKTITTPFTKMMGTRYPIIGAPMFLVSNEDMTVNISEAGGLGVFPALNYRPIENYKKAIQTIKSRTQKPIGVNIIVNKSNQFAQKHLEIALAQGVEFFITSLGNPKQVIQEAHKQNSKVFCDVTNLEHAKKVQDMGADGVIAVAGGAGGHAGPISPLVLIPWLAKELEIPVVLAGGIADGRTMAAAIALGACAVSVGTRFIATHEAQVESAYKEAILDASPEDIVMTSRVSGTPASVINTEYVKKIGTELPFIVRALKEQKWAKKYIVPLIHFAGMKSLEKAAQGPTWKTVWCAGQSVGLIDEILTCEEVIKSMVTEYEHVVRAMPI